MGPTSPEQTRPECAWAQIGRLGGWSNLLPFPLSSTTISRILRLCFVTGLVLLQLCSAWGLEAAAPQIDHCWLLRSFRGSFSVFVLLEPRADEAFFSPSGAATRQNIFSALSLFRAVPKLFTRIGTIKGTELCLVDVA